MGYPSFEFRRSLDAAIQRDPRNEQRGFRLFRSNRVWCAVGPNFRSFEETPGQPVGYGEGPCGRRDAVNQLFGKTRMTSPTSPLAFEVLDAAPA